MSISVDIEKTLGSFRLDVHFSGGDEVVALLGASGCGKSMTLKCIAGIERPDRGRIVLDGETLFDSEKHIDLTPQQRRTGLMFQNYALFPNMTVLQNIQAGARRERDRGARERAVSDIIESFALTELAEHYPHQLSGGQQQRTALARILVSNPGILLLDEPFSALDSHLRFRLEQEVRGIIRRFGKSVILVSHDRDEVFRLSDKVAVIHEGGIEAFGTKKEVFTNPATRHAAILTGCKNISRIEKLGDNRVYAADWGMELETAREVGSAACIGIRMHDIKPDGERNRILCNVAEVIENQFSYTIMLKPLSAEAAAPVGWELDKDDWRRLQSDRLAISLPPDSLVLMEGK